jgi:hypothetical protein
MTNEAQQLLAEALKRIRLSDGFSPEEIGARIGLDKPQAQAAARLLSNQGIVVLGFDFAAHFSPEFRKARARAEKRPTRAAAR